jgi:hypothetical protein
MESYLCSELIMGYSGQGVDIDKSKLIINRQITTKISNVYFAQIVTNIIKFSLG